MSADEHFRTMLVERFPELTDRAGWVINYDAALEEERKYAHEAGHRKGVFDEIDRNHCNQFSEHNEGPCTQEKGHANGHVSPGGTRWAEVPGDWRPLERAQTIGRVLEVAARKVMEVTKGSGQEIADAIRGLMGKSPPTWRGEYHDEIAKEKRAERRNALDETLRMASVLFYSAEVQGLIGKLDDGELLSRFMELFKEKVGSAIEAAMGKEESDGNGTG